MRAQIVAAARALKETPYAAHQRTPGVGIDCAGVPIVVAWECGLKPRSFDINGYSLWPDGTLLAYCDQHLERITQAEMQAGDVVIVSWGQGDAQHFGIVADHTKYTGHLSIIHAESVKHKKVVEHRLVFGRHMRFIAAYRFPGVACPN